MKIKSLSLLLLALVPLPAVATPPAVPLFTGTGSHTRQVTTSSVEAQRYFDQGLAFLYAFNHDEAIRSFQAAAELDPACAMAWWGVACAAGPHINFPFVPEPRAQLAWAAIQRAQQAAASATPSVRRCCKSAACRKPRRFTVPISRAGPTTAGRSSDSRAP